MPFSMMDVISMGENRIYHDPYGSDARLAL